MEKPITRICCNNQLWLVILVSFVFCFVLLCFDYSALTGTQDSFTVLVNNYENAVATQKSKSLLLPNNVNETTIRPNITGYIRKQPQPSREESVAENSVKDSCLGRYVYIHEIPSKFNQELLDNCESITRGTEHNMCPYLVNSGLGVEVENSQGVLLNKSWYSTNQFLLEVIFHNRMKKYECLTNDSSLASAIYVPFYAGLDVSRYLWGVKTSIRDQSAFDLMKWLVQRPEWKKMLGRDHFLIAGRIAWDFRRQTDNESDWGSKFRFLPESNNMSMLAIESSSWNNDYAIPYPTCFHPSKESEVSQWQDKMRNQTRPYLFSFAGAPRPDLQESVRGKIIEECQASKSLCKLLECDYGANGAINCDNPVNVMRLFQNSVYCLQPTGDSYTRRSIFDSILAGCIPVFFHPGTAYAQYKWHLPKNYSKYSVYIPVRDVKEWKAGINETLLRIPEDRVLAMREEVIKIIPSIIYADPRSRMETTEDAFDLAVKGILERIERVTKVTKEGKDPSIGFADGDDYKYTFSGYLGETNSTKVYY
ncbi:probable xyloglucan galactosyltransferase GT14 [Ricinus communis]|uniref:probable xyloglucan galactosyltransferase GT14 n=1 Tax=Ricinus communis TaxID=3988 RepID=UPI00201A2367|nr:probable xyloglucan galactosyltransferase GT14 [Ricinus communis]